MKAVLPVIAMVPCHGTRLLSLEEDVLTLAALRNALSLMFVVPLLAVTKIESAAWALNDDEVIEGSAALSQTARRPPVSETWVNVGGSRGLCRSLGRRPSRRHSPNQERSSG